MNARVPRATERQVAWFSDKNTDYSRACMIRVPAHGEDGDVKICHRFPDLFPRDEKIEKQKYYRAA